MYGKLSPVCTLVCQDVHYPTSVDQVARAAKSRSGNRSVVDLTTGGEHGFIVPLSASVGTSEWWIDRHGDVQYTHYISSRTPADIAAYVGENSEHNLYVTMHFSLGSLMFGVGGMFNERDDREIYLGHSTGYRHSKMPDPAHMNQNLSAFGKIIGATQYIDFHGEYASVDLNNRGASMACGTLTLSCMGQGELRRVSSIGIAASFDKLDQISEFFINAADRLNETSQCPGSGQVHLQTDRSESEQCATVARGIAGLWEPRLYGKYQKGFDPYQPPPESETNRKIYPVLNCSDNKTTESHMLVTVEHFQGTSSLGVYTQRDPDFARTVLHEAGLEHLITDA